MENQEKKEYVAPQMSVVEYEHQRALLLNHSGDVEIDDEYKP